MRIVVTAVTAGEEVGRQVVEERDVQNVGSQMIYSALSQYRDERNVLGEFADVVITVKPHYRRSASGLQFSGGHIDVSDTAASATSNAETDGG